jgi:hypothetical protein
VFQKVRFVSGHDFSRAAKAAEKGGGLSTLQNNLPGWKARDLSLAQDQQYNAGFSP